MNGVSCDYRYVCAKLVVLRILFGCERFEESREGAASVTEGELGGDVEFGHGILVGWQVEERVVAKAVGASRLGEDFAFDGSVANGEDVGASRGGEDAVIAAAALGERNVGEEREEIEIVAFVDRVMLRRVEVVVVGETGGADAGGSVESVDFEAGVVGQYELVGEML